MKTLRQPHSGMIQAARKPPNAAPSGKPQNIALVSVARRRSGQYSLIKVTALGIAAPRPRPVTKRQYRELGEVSVKPEARQQPQDQHRPIRNALGRGGRPVVPRRRRPG